LAAQSARGTPQCAQPICFVACSLRGFAHLGLLATLLQSFVSHLQVIEKKALRLSTETIADIQRVSHPKGRGSQAIVGGLVERPATLARVFILVPAVASRSSGARSNKVTTE